MARKSFVSLGTILDYERNVVKRHKKEHITMIASVCDSTSRFILHGELRNGLVEIPPTYEYLAKIVLDVQILGARLYVKDGKLLAEPMGVVANSQEMCDRIAANKQALIDLLTTPPPVDVVDARPLVPIVLSKIGEQEVNSVSARDLYLDLGLDGSNWARWSKENIVENNFFAQGVDFVELALMASSPNPTKDFAVSMNMAKHIAMMAKTQRAHDYRNYFIECEKVAKGEAPKVEASVLEKLATNNAIIKEAVLGYNMLGIEGNQAVLGANKIATQATGFDILKMIGASDIVSPVQARYYAPKDLAPQTGFVSANAFNTHLEKNGYQKKEVYGKDVDGKDKWHWVATEKGKPFSVVTDTDKKYATGTFQALRWYDTIIVEIEP